MTISEDMLIHVWRANSSRLYDRSRCDSSSRLWAVYSSMASAIDADDGDDNDDKFSHRTTWWNVLHSASVISHVK